MATTKSVPLRNNNGTSAAEEKPQPKQIPTIRPRVQRITRSTQGLRDVLFEELDALRSGQTTPQRASAIAKLTSEICNTIRIEMYYQRVTAGLPRAGDPMLEAKEVFLGSDENGQES